MNFNRSIVHIILISLLISNYGCRNYKKEIPYTNDMNKVNEEQFKLLFGKKIFFGHQSVGYNIIAGIEELTRGKYPYQIEIIETRNVDSLRSPVFIHAKIGKNKYPKTKIDDFISLMRSGFADSIDIAIIKLCYVDVDRNTDVEDLFSYYKTNFNSIQHEYPHTQFIHMTIPLRSKVTGIKGLIKRLIRYTDNIKRERYNAMLRETYNDNILFDIALVESTFPDGKREKDAGNSFALVPAYTNDGGHLNEIGRKLVAEKFLLFLAKIEN